MMELGKMVLSLSFSGSLLLLMICLLRPLWKERFSRTWQYYVWMLVLGRLLLPISLEPSLAGWIFSGWEAVKEEGSGNSMAAMPNGNGEKADREIGMDAYQEGAFVYTNILQKDPAASDGKAFSSVDEGTDGTAAKGWQQDRSFWIHLGQIVGPWLGLLWLLPALCMAAWRIFRYQRYIRGIRCCQVRVEDPVVLECLGIAEEKVYRRRKGKVRVLVVPEITTPMLTGVLHPEILLPHFCFSQQELVYALMHELIHEKRKDILWKWVTQLSICIHWFNPLVHWMAGKMDRDCELSCDEQVVERLPEREVKGYGEMLLHVAGTAGKRKASAVCPASEGKVLLKERLEAMMKKKKRSGFLRWGAVLTAIGLSIGAMAAGAYAMQNQGEGEAAFKEQYKTTLGDPDLKKASVKTNKKKQLHITAKGGRIVVIRSANKKEVKLHYNKKYYKVRNTATEKTRKIVIKGSDESNRYGNHATQSEMNEKSVMLYVPDALYDTIVVDVQSASAILQELKSDYQIKSDSSAVSLNVKRNLSHEISLTGDCSAIAIDIMTKKVKDYKVRIKSLVSAVSLSGNFPEFSVEHMGGEPYTYQKGKGKTKLLIDLESCAFSMDAVKK